MSLPGKLLSQQQILQRVYDETTQTLKTTSSGSSTIIIDHLDDSIAIGDQNSGNLMTVESDGSINSNIPGVVPVAGRLPVDGSGVTQPISAASLPLPSGASTLSEQQAQTTILSSIDGKLTSPLTIQSTNLDVRDLVFASDKVDVSGSSVSVSNFPATQDVQATDLDIRDLVFASDKVDVSGSTVALDSATLAALENITVTVDNEVEIKNDAGNPVPVSGTVTANLGTIADVATETTLSAINAKFNSLGQKTMAASAPVVIASDQSPIPISSTGITKKRTYSAAVLGQSVANNATDIFSIHGSNAAVIRITKIRISATQTTAGQVNIQILKRSSASATNGSTILTNVPHDSTNIAGTAEVRSRTSNPGNLGTLVGAIRTDKIFINTTTGQSDRLIYEFDNEDKQALTLRGVQEQITINLNGVSVAGGNFNISVEWTEE